nr:hypothetical protein [uncultured Dyadobacter sp.]
MSEQTQVIEENSELLPEAPVAAKKGKGKAGAAMAAGAAAGLGAVAYDAYADDLTGKQDAASADSTATPGPMGADSTDSQAPADSLVADSGATGNAGTTAQPAVMLIPDHLNIVNAPDEMSFNEAFAWSREKAGPAQLFEWQGELYHTCHASEYALLPAETKDLFEEMWIGNAFGVMDIPVEGQMLTYDIIEEPAEVTDQPMATDTVDTTETHPTDTVVAEQDSASMDTDEYDIVYSQDDYDNNFDGLDEWVNPEDIA